MVALILGLVFGVGSKGNPGDDYEPWYPPSDSNVQPYEKFMVKRHGMTGELNAQVGVTVAAQGERYPHSVISTAKYQRDNSLYDPATPLRFTYGAWFEEYDRDLDGYLGWVDSSANTDADYAVVTVKNFSTGKTEEYRVQRGDLVPFSFGLKPSDRYASKEVGISARAYNNSGREVSTNGFAVLTPTFWK